MVWWCVGPGSSSFLPFANWVAQESNIDVAICAMSRVRDVDASHLQDMMNRIKHVPAEDRARVFNLVLGYVCDYNENITQDNIVNLETRTSEEHQMVLSAAEAFREEGRQEGCQKMQQLQRIYDTEAWGPEEIVEVTKLNREQVESLRQEISGALER